jgi:hypothetical protein
MSPKNFLTIFLLNKVYFPNAFSGFCQKFPQAMDEVENFFFANFQILEPLGCQGWVVIPQNVKKGKITAP